MGDKYYRKEFPELAEQYIKDGLGLPEIASKLGLTLNQLNERARVHPDFAAALRLPFGGEHLNDKVEEALLRRALGYQSKEIYSEEIVDSDTGEVIKQLKRRTVVKTVPPDVRAALLWLQNHRPDVWGSGAGASDIDGLLSGIDPEDSDLL